MLLEIKPVVRRSDEFGNVSFRYGNVVWSIEAGCDEEIAMALMRLWGNPGVSLWVDGKAECYTMEERDRG